MNQKATLRYLFLAAAVTLMVALAPDKSGARDLSSSSVDVLGSSQSALTTVASIAGSGVSGKVAGPAYGAIFALAPAPGTWATLLGGLGTLVCLQRFRRPRRSI